MSIQDLGNIGEFISAIAVVISLIYLAIQVKSGRIALEDAQVRERLNQEFASNEYFNQLRNLVASDEQLASIEIRGIANLSSLDEVERRRFDELMLGWVWAIQKYYHQQKIANLAVEFEESAVPFFKRRFRGTGFIEWWEMTKAEVADPEFRKAIDQVVKVIQDESESNP